MDGDKSPPFQHFYVACNSFSPSQALDDYRFIDPALGIGLSRSLSVHNAFYEGAATPQCVGLYDRIFGKVVHIVRIGRWILEYLKKIHVLILGLLIYE